MAESYKGFMIVEDPPRVVKAYRNLAYFSSGTSSYEDITHIGIREQIDEVEDSGDYTVEELALSEMDNEVTEIIRGLPFMPQKGQPLPEYVVRELYPSPAWSLMEAPVSEYGGAVVQETGTLLKEFMAGGSFVLGEKFGETGWSSDDITCTGYLVHVPTRRKYLAEVSVLFKWREPQQVEQRTVTLFEEKDEAPEDIWSGELGFKGGQEADQVLRSRA